MAAWAIDWIPQLVVLSVTSALVFPEDPNIPITDADMLRFWGVGLGFAWLYETVPLVSRRQATLGMRALGIFRTDLHGDRLSFVRATLWYAVRLLSYSALALGFLLALLSRRRQTLHDRIAGTVVLRRPPRRDK